MAGEIIRSETLTRSRKRWRADISGFGGIPECTEMEMTCRKNDWSRCGNAEFSYGIIIGPGRGKSECRRWNGVEFIRQAQGSP